MKFKVGDKVIIYNNKRYTGVIISIYTIPKLKPIYVLLDRTNFITKVYEHKITLLPNPADILKELLK